MEIKEMVELIRALQKPKREKKTIDKGVRIVILQRGWVVVGRYLKTGSQVTLKNAAVIRRWGTTEGLPELANKGPLPETKLEKSCDIEFHELVEIASIICCEDKWKSAL